MARKVLPAGRKLPVMSEEKRKKIFGNLKETKHAIEERYHLPAYAADLGKALIEGKLNNIIRLLKEISITEREIFECLPKEKRLKLLKTLRKASMEVIYPLTTREHSMALEMDYEKKWRAVVEEVKEVLPEDSKSYTLLEKALAYIPSLIYRDPKESRLGQKIAWIGRSAPNTKPGKVVLVLSGGSAKGVVYHGLLKAFEEHGLFPDFIVGTSAGALAGAAFATGKGVKHISKALSPGVLKKIFMPLQAPITLFSSGFSGILGMGFDRHLKRVFGERRGVDRLRDVFIVACVQDPVSFGRTIIGKGSALNKNVAMSEGIEVWRAVLGSCAIQGVVPPAVIERPFRAKRTVKGQFGVKVEFHDMPYACLDDGSVVESLPITTASHLLEHMGEDGLIIAVNLTNISPSRYKKVEHNTLKELLKMEKNKVPFWGKLKAYTKWLIQEAKKRFRRIAPLRAFEGFEQMYAQNTVQSIRSIQGSKDIILVNMNYDGRLSELTLTNISKKYEQVASYGYEVGDELCTLLLGEQDR